MANGGYNPGLVAPPDSIPIGTGKWNGMHALQLGGKLSVTLAAGTSNNYDPSGAHTTISGFNSRVDLNPNAGAALLTGFDATGATDEKRLKLRNVSTVNTVTLQHLNGGSSATNQFYCPNLTDFLLTPGQVVALEYWLPDAVWVLIA